MKLQFIVFTGPESSGKTFLATHFAKKYDLKMIPETARAYLDKHGLEYGIKDILNMAKNHVQLESKVSSEEECVLLDTDLLTLLIWSQEVFGEVPPFIERDVESYEIERIYFLCKPDIPWEFDPQRENKTDRDRLFGIYKTTLEYFGLPYFIISGSYDERIEMAENYINKLI